MDLENRTRQVLDLLHRHLTLPPGSSGTEELLHELTRAFAAAGAGLACVREGQLVVQQRVRLHGVPAPGTPWAARSELQQQLQRVSVLGWASAGESYLAASSPKADRLLWLEADAGRQWSRPEQAALTLAAASIDLLAPGDAPAPEQLRYSQRLQDAAVLSGKLAHAFDNILTGILGFAELTLSQAPADSETARYIAEVLGAAQQGVQLTQQFHQFSRSSAVAAGSASVSLVLAELENRLRSSIPASVTLTMEVAADLPRMAIAGETLQQALQHLAANAHEAVGASGKITISARRAEISREQAGVLLGRLRPGLCVEIAISDTGPGISAEAQQRLFVEPFYSNKPRHRGLGLALAYRILYAHNAAFTLQPGPGGGTMARVYLPLCQP